MNHASQRSHCTRLVAVYLLVTALPIGSVGCSGEAADDIALDNQGAGTGVVGQELILSPATGYLRIINEDPRHVTDVTVTFEGTDTRGGQYYSDWQALPRPLYGYWAPGFTGSWQYLNWDINAATKPDILYTHHETSGGLASEIQIIDRSADTRFDHMFVTVRGTIDGACHEDWEEVSMLDKKTIYFDGRNASWNGSCWVGDLLRHNW